MNIEFSYPNWYILICVLVGLLYSFLFYRKENLLSEVKKAMVYAMAFFRFSATFILAILLLEPLIEVEKQIVEKPVLVIAQDNSESILINKDSSYLKGDYVIALQSFKDKLSEKYEVKTFVFGEKVEQGLAIDYSEKQTDFSDLLNELYTRYYGRNLGAVIIASDGIVNRGVNPIYEAKKIKHTPFFTIALGDTLIRKDVILNNVVHNRIAYKGNEFPVEIVVHANQHEGEKAKVSVLKDGKELISEEVFFESSNSVQTVKVNLIAEKSGKQKYTVQVQELEGELTYINNSKVFYIDILDSKQEILILAKAPHPDISAIKLALSNNLNYEVSANLINDFKGEVNDYSLVVLHQLPSSNTSENKIIQSFIKAKIPCLFIAGTETNYNQLNNYNLGIKLIGVNGVTDVTTSVNVNFTQFNISDVLGQSLPKYPPLQVPFAGSYKALNSANVLLYQKIGATTTNYPLLLFNEKNEAKYGFLLGEGIWRWKLKDYSDNKSHDNFNALITKMVQYLAVKEDKSKFKVYCETSFLENEPVIFEAELYNDSYDLVNDSDVLLEITNEDGEVYPAKSFTKSGNAYRLDAGVFDVGNYKYRAEVNYDGGKKEVSGEFVVKELKTEYANVVANHGMLYNLATQSNGEMYFPNELDLLLEAIVSKEEIVDISYLEKDVSDVINWKWIFALILLLLSMEWFMRKRNGAY